MVGISNRLAEFRRQANLSQEEFANLVGVRRETIIRVEGGKYYPSLLVAHDIAVALGRSIDEVFFPDEGEVAEPIREVQMRVKVAEKKVKYETQRA